MKKVFSTEPLLKHSGEYIEKFEKYITLILILLMITIVTLSVADLVRVLIKDILSPPLLLLDVDELLNSFGMFLMIMIGIELIETLKAYSHKREVRAEVIILVAVIALARKVVILDLKIIDPISLLALAAIIIALAICYYLIKRTHKVEDENE